MHASACSLVFFSQGRATAALWHQDRTGKTSGFFGCGRRAAARLRHGVVAIHSGSYWIINTLVSIIIVFFAFSHLKALYEVIFTMRTGK
ncbi:hypothetical protein TS65_30450 [Aneurinibacillus migulanus]|uniref:Uncharacterized protein n=1 Tax=Aneurinibacillus migulanus TaxID=47500 RepID=A0A0D1VV93_ANEMI|nr:hypothetical protein TS65_30450 [Aneurinibacillus migulanus]KON96187.1 hypothetical protein AF333_12535 [Aneurinibacillus migulanus]